MPRPPPIDPELPDERVGLPPRTGPGYEAWLLSWLPGQGSGPHDHGRSSCVLTVLAGTLTEWTGRGTRALSTGAQRAFRSAQPECHGVVGAQV